MASKSETLRTQIFDLVQEYYDEAFPPREFVAGQTSIPVSGRVFDAGDLKSLVNAALDFWLTSGPFAEQFERNFARYFGLRHALLVNSGSSANLLAVACLTSPALGKQRLQPGDEVITVAAGFPSTVNPIIQYGLIPVFLDIEIPSYNVDVSQLEYALSERTRAVILAHTLGNPFAVDAVADFASRHNLWLIEDCCDATGSLYKGKKVGTFGHIATVSFYPAHHITMGEGGCVLTNDSVLKKLIESFRDWGRDCWCDPGKDNTCGRRFEWQLADLPVGYDHKYVYTHIGYNLKLTDMQAAVGLAQLQKLPTFIKMRQRNFDYLIERLRPLQELFILPEPMPFSEPSWFGFPLAVRTGAPFTRRAIIRFLEERKISTRLLFGGNLVRQPAYKQVPYRVVGSLERSDFAMENVFWIGLYPGLSLPMLDYVIRVFHDFSQQFRK